MIGRDAITSPAIAILLPCLTVAVLTIIKELYRSLMPDFLFTGLALASLVAGFAFLARAFRRQALWIGLVYFPVMFVVLLYVGFTVIGVVFHGP